MKNFEDFRGFIDGELMAIAITDAVNSGIRIDKSNIDLINAITTINHSFTMKALEEYHRWLHFDSDSDV